MKYVFLNGAIVEAVKARVPTIDRGLLLGDGLFETMRAYGSKVFRLKAHLDRLRASAEFFRLRFELSDDETADAIGELIRRNECEDAYVRLTLTRGWETPGLRLGSKGAPTVLIHVRPRTPYPPERYRRGADLIISTIRQNSASPLTRHKTLNYLTYLLARQEAVDAGAHGAILLNEVGQVTEESVSNLFLVRSDALWTPPVHSGLLPGITRSAVMEVAVRAGIPIRESPIAAGEIFEFDEAFMTNSLMEVMPIRSVDKRRLGEGLPGPLTQRIQKLFAKLVEKETA